MASYIALLFIEFICIVGVNVSKYIHKEVKSAGLVDIHLYRLQFFMTQKCTELYIVYVY